MDSLNLAGIPSNRLIIIGMNATIVMVVENLSALLASWFEDPLTGKEIK